MVRFRRGQQILCHYGGVLWVDGTIAKTPYILSEYEAGHDERLSPDEEVPYQVRLHPSTASLLPGDGSGFIFVPEDNNTCCRELSSENMVQLGVHNSILQRHLSPIICKDKKKARCLLQLAVNHRQTSVAKWIVRKVKFPMQVVGRELLKLAVKAHPDSIVYKARSEQEEDFLIDELDNLMTWIAKDCDTPIETFVDEHDYHAEHVAAIAGDSILLLWILKKNWEYARSPEKRDQFRKNATSSEQLPGLPCDKSGNTPLHYMSSSGKSYLIRCYRKNESSFQYIEDFDAVNAEGQTALDIAKDAATADALRDLQKNVYQMKLNRALQFSSAMDNFEDLEKIIDEYKLDIEVAMSGHFATTIDKRVAVFDAIQKGNLCKLQWFIKKIKVADISLENDEGLTLLHIAARMDKNTLSRRENMIKRLENGDSFWQGVREKELQCKELFLEYHWDGKSDLINAMETFDKSDSRRRGLGIDEYKHYCIGNGKTSGRLEIIKWLMEGGLILPEIDFILNECDFPTAKLLLECRIAADNLVNNLFEYRSPLAMELIKGYLYMSPTEALQTVSKIAFSVIEEPKNDPYRDTDAKRLLLLKWLVDYAGVDPTKLRTESGNTMLHEAIYNNQTFIAVWLAVNYPILTQLKGKKSGKLPVHLALELAPLDTNYMAYGSLAFLMILYSGEARGYNGWIKDQRVWNLPDRDGRSVRDYAKHCKEMRIYNEAWEPAMKSSFASMVEMLGDTEATEDQFDAYCSKHSLHGFIKRLGDRAENVFLYAAIALGRLDILQWYEATFHNENEEKQYNGLAKWLGEIDKTSSWEQKRMLPRVSCSRIDKVGVADNLEILSSIPDPEISFRGELGELYTSHMIDGVWLLSGWIPHSDYACSMRVENCKVFSNEPGMNPAEFKILNGVPVLYANDGNEIWESVNKLENKGFVDRLDFKRYETRSWVGNGRTISLTKLKEIDPNIQYTKRWRAAKVTEANAENLRITFVTSHQSGFGLDSSFDEWIPRNSERINASGRLKLKYCIDNYHVYAESDWDAVISGRELASWVGHSHVIDWIDSGTAPSQLRTKLDDANDHFLREAFGNATILQLEEILVETQNLVNAAKAKGNSALEAVVLDAQNDLYVLQKCWESQPPLDYRLPYSAFNDNKLYHQMKTLGLFRCMARMGFLDRIRWMIKTRKIKVDSDHAIGALFDAADIDDVAIVNELVCSGVDFSQRFAVNAHMITEEDSHDHFYNEEESLIEHSISELCGEVVCYLFSGNYFPRRELTHKLLSKAVGKTFFLSKDENEQKKKAKHRLDILKAAVAHGFDLNGRDPDRESTILCDALKTFFHNNYSDRNYCTPITQDLIEWLCSEGCDIVSAMTEQFLYKDTEVPEWMNNMVKLSKSTWPLCDAIEINASTDELELLLNKVSVDVCDVRDRKGRTLLELATIGGHLDCLTWLVKKKGMDISRIGSTGKTALQLANDLGMKDTMQRIQWLKKWHKNNKKKMEAQQKKNYKAAVRLQTVIRIFLATKKLEKMQQMASFGVWSKIVLKVLDLELNIDGYPFYFGKSWMQLKVESNLVVQEELDLLDSTMLHSEDELTCNDELALEANLKSHATNKVTETMVKKANSIQLTADALKWIRRTKDEKFRNMFAKRLRQLAQGDRSYCLSKTLKGSSRVVTETKLDGGQRIIWTQRSNDILIWFICKHKDITRCLNLVDMSYERVDNSRLRKKVDWEGIVETTPSGNDESNHAGLAKELDQDPEIFVNPTANVPLKIHTVDTLELDRLVSDDNWTPIYKLTKQEDDIVNRQGTVLLLGRAGTGKTYCVCNRMARDRAQHGNTFSQLFVARTRRLCELVKTLQKGAGEDVSNSRFVKIRDLVEEISESTDKSTGNATWPSNKHVSYKVFCDHIWDEIRGKEKELDALHIWTQICSFIVGSFEAAQSKRPLDESHYVEKISKDRCRLDTGKRRRAYDIFKRYWSYKEKHGLWDDASRTASAIQTIQRNKDLQGTYNRIYVDEVQDFTQAEVGLLFLLSGSHNALFLVGDTAQAVCHGVDFRFEEVRSIVHKISSGNDRIQRWEKLSRNFRSHEGILRVANLVLEGLYKLFPSAAAKLPPDIGLVHGPRPGLLLAEGDFATLTDLILGNKRLRVLVRDEYKKIVNEKLSKICVEAQESIFGIREAKGLEFSDVVILDFFASTADERKHHKAWKQLLLESSKGVNGKEKNTVSIPVTMELEIKLLYTAITRSCNRLLFIETKSSQGFDAWCRCLIRLELAQMVSASTVKESGSKSAVMTPDEWRVEGIEVASLAEDENIQTSENLLKRAISYFKKAGDVSLEKRAKAHLRAVQFERDFEVNNFLPVTEAPRQEGDAASAALAYLEAGMLIDAARLCTTYSTDHQSTQLGKRIMKLLPVV